jgi:hypothetical protein
MLFSWQEGIMMLTGQTTAFTRTGEAVRRDILIALAIKISLLTALYYCFFAENHRPKVDPESTATALLDHSTVNP